MTTKTDRPKVKQLLQEHVESVCTEDIPALIEAIRNGDHEKINEDIVSFEHGAVVFCTNGPHIELCINCGAVYGYWGNKRAVGFPSREEINTIAEFVSEVTA